jgi:hypothetical protein
VGIAASRAGVGGGRDTQAVLWGHGAGSGRGRADSARSPQSPVGLWGRGPTCIPLGSLAAAGPDNNFLAYTVRPGLQNASCSLSPMSLSPQ